MFRKTILMSLFLLGVGLAQAHPPSDIRLTTHENLVTIKVMHDTLDVMKHFIIEVRVSLNGKQVIKQTFDRQSSVDSQDALYTIPNLKKGDQLTVQAFCSIYGNKTKKFTIQE